MCVQKWSCKQTAKSSETGSPEAFVGNRIDFPIVSFHFDQVPLNISLMLPLFPSALTPLFASSRSFIRHASTSTPARPARSRTARWARRSAVVLAIGGGVYVYDREMNASAITRSVKTGWIGWVIIPLELVELLWSRMLLTPACSG